MIKVYVAGAISSPVLEQGLMNLRQGILAGAELMKLGFNPFVPHLNAQYSLVQDEFIDVKTHYECDLAWLTVCDCMLVLPNYEQSKGVAAEIEFAKQNGIPVYYNIDELLAATTEGKNHELLC